MMRFLVQLTAILVLLGVLSSCISEQVPAELAFNAKRAGQGTPCRMQLFNAAGKQVSEVSSDLNGVGYAKDLKPGKYTVKFVDANGQAYPAVRTVTLKSEDTQVLDVDLDLADDPAAGGAPPA